jgi:ABC-type transporter Mla MlaB component
MPAVVLARGGDEIARWPLHRPARLDLATVDDLARLRLSALRLGCTVHVRNPCEDLRALLDLAGLGDVVDDSAE